MAKTRKAERKSRKDRKDRKDRKSRKDRKDRKDRKSRKSGNAWNQAVMRVFAEMKRKDRGTSFRAALQEASRRKKAGNL